MSKVKPRNVILLLVLAALLWYGLAAWAGVLVIGSVIILSAFGNHPYLAAVLICGPLIGISLLVDRWIRPKLPQSVKTAYKVLFICFLIMLGSILPATFLVNKGLPSTRQVSFNEAAWKANKRGVNDFPKKVNMVESLKNDHLKIGMTRDEVVQLLGDCSKPDDKCTINLGEQRDSIFAIDSSLLTLNFTDNRLTSFEEWSD